jgi:selenide,water dikinase
VTGRVHPDRILVKGGLRPGDRLFLSKPLGTGVITTAAKNSVAKPDVLAGAVASMLRLNRVAARVAGESGAKGATDITGFGFLGHAGEMVRASRAGLALDASRLPILPGTRELAEAGQFSGGMKRNRRHVDSMFGADLSIDPSVPGYLVSLLTEAETSGGLLFSVAPERAGTVVEAFRRLGEECWEIGSVLAEPVIRVKA